MISQGNNESNPYMQIYGSRNGDNVTLPPLILGNTASLHFQSFLPIEEDSANYRKPEEFVNVATPEKGMSAPIEEELVVLPRMSTPKRSLNTPLSPKVMRVKEIGNIVHRIEDSENYRKPE